MARKQINIRAGFDLAAFSTSQQNLIRGLRKTASQFKQIGKEMSMSITAPLVAMGGLAVKTFAEFEQSMAKVNAVSGATATQFKALNQLAKDLGASTRFTATEVADLMLNYSKLGFSASEIEAMTGATLNLALATGEDLAKSAEVAGSTLRAFGLDADQMLRVTDVMAKSFSSSALDLDRFSESMKYVAPVAAAAGISIEETSAMLSILANNGVKGSQAGTSLRRIISDLGATGDNVSESIANLAKKGLNLADAKDEVGRTAQSALLILSKGVNQIKPLTTEYENVTDAAKDMAGIMDDTLQGSMLALKSKIEAVAISFGEGMAPAIGKVAEKIGALADWFKNLSPQVQDFILIVAGLAAAIGPLVYGIGLLTSAMAMLALPMAPYIILFAAITAAAVALGVAMAHTSKVFPHVEASIKTMKTSYEKLGEQIGKINDLKKQGVLASGEAIKANIAETRSVLAKTAADVKGAYEKRQALLDELKSRKELHKGKMFTFGTGTTAMTNVVETKKTQESINQLNIEISAAQQQIIAAGQATKDLELQLQGLENVDLAPLGDKIGTVGKEIKQLGIDFKEGIAASDLQSPAIDAIQKGITSKGLKFVPIELKANLSPEQLREELTKLEKSIYEPVMVPIDLKPIEITQELFDQQAIAAAKRQAADLGEEMGDALSSGLKALATEGLTQFGEFLGTVISGGDMTVKDFGRGLLDSLGKFMSQFGEAMVAMGIAQIMLDVALKSFNPALAIIGGVALIAAGAAISNLSQKGIDKSGGMDSSFSGGGNFSSMSGIGANMQPIVLDTRISGRDMIITQGRESQFKR
jgi:phage-related minor tail protein